MTLGLSLLRTVAQGLAGKVIAKRTGLTCGAVSNHLTATRTPGPRARDAYARCFGIDAGAWDRLA